MSLFKHLLFIAQQRCLESLTARTPPADEIIAIDDGSIDDCPRILAEFAPRVPQMRVIRQENGGLSAARDTGLGAAHGKYLAFVDSDDFVEPDAYAEALQQAESGQLDTVLLNFGGLPATGCGRCSPEQ